MFLITLFFFILFISCILFLQTIFFQDFYTNTKMGMLENNIEQLEKDYNKENNNETIDNYDQTTYNNLVNLFRSFEDNNNCKVGILDKYGRFVTYTGPKNALAQSASEKIIRQVINDWLANPAAFISIKKSGKSKTYIFNNKAYDVKNIVCVMPDNTTNEVLFAVSSLQPVDEAASVIKQFYIYVYLSIVFIIIIMSIIYSNLITKPLNRLNKTATQIANLDFSQKYISNRKDEIGNLGNTLNFLSTNLNNSLNSLKKANEKLKADIEKERELEKMRKEFVGGVSHELKTPISLIEGYAEGIKDGIFEAEDQNYYMDVIIDEAKKMGNLVSDMLDLSQLESGNFKLVFEHFYIDKLLNGTIKKYYTLFTDKEIDVQINLISNVLVNGDRIRIEQVITNFVTNAIRHTYEKGKISISMKENGDKIYIYVGNSGENIETEDLPKIWDKFYKTDKSRNREIGGTGLGLAIVKNILLLHKSDFGVTNFEGGVAFFFSLDIVKESVPMDYLE